MLELKTSILISVAFVVYYSVFFLFDDLKRLGMATDSPNKSIEAFRSKYGVNIRTFQENSRCNGFVWFNAIWLNENILKNKQWRDFNFHHEHYHLMHKHKQKTLLARFSFALTLMFTAIVPYYVFIPVVIGLGWLLFDMSRTFERKANAHAHNMTSNEKKG